MHWEGIRLDIGVGEIQISNYCGIPQETSHVSAISRGKRTVSRDNYFQDLINFALY